MRVKGMSKTLNRAHSPFVKPKCLLQIQSRQPRIMCLSYPNNGCCALHILIRSWLHSLSSPLLSLVKPALIPGFYIKAQSRFLCAFSFIKYCWGAEVSSFMRGLRQSICTVTGQRQFRVLRFIIVGRERSQLKYKNCKRSLSFDEPCEDSIASNLSE